MSDPIIRSKKQLTLDDDVAESPSLHHVVSWSETTTGAKLNFPLPKLPYALLTPYHLTHITTSYCPLFKRGPACQRTTGWQTKKYGRKKEPLTKTPYFNMGKVASAVGFRNTILNSLPEGSFLTMNCWCLGQAGSVWSLEVLALLFSSYKNDSTPVD